MDPARRRQLERDLEELARRHARRAIDTPAYLAERARLATLIDEAVPSSATVLIVSPDRAIS